MRNLAISSLSFVSICFGLLATAIPAQSKPFVGFPVTTPLQRKLLFNSDADACVQLDVASCVRDGKFDADCLAEAGFEDMLSALRSSLDKEDCKLSLYLRLDNTIETSVRNADVESIVADRCRKAGFKNVETITSYGGDDWGKQFDTLPKDPSLIDESPIVDEFMRIYPVRTSLSKLCLGDNNFDCFIEIRQPVDARFEGFTNDSRDRIKSAVNQLDLTERRKLSFRIITTRAGTERANNYFGRHGGQPPKVHKFVQALGFEESRYSNTPMGVSPEDLLGKTAPAFELTALDGGLVKFPEISAGKCAVIAFWGVGCGACCEEAPHLTALQQKVGAQDLIVIAVNGYDEPRDEVAKYARENGLTHTIALMGGSVAKDKYTVVSYPITYFVDRSGKITDYHLGFESGDEFRMDAAVDRLLRQ